MKKKLIYSATAFGLAAAAYLIWKKKSIQQMVLRTGCRQF